MCDPLCILSIVGVVVGTLSIHVLIIGILIIINIIVVKVRMRSRKAYEFIHGGNIESLSELIFFGPPKKKVAIGYYSMECITQ